MERHSDFWHDRRRHIGPRAVPKRHGHRHRPQPHADTAFPMNSLIVSFPKSCRLQPPGPMFPGCGLWTRPRGQEGREKYRGGLASPLGDAIGPTIWPVSLSLNCSWPLCCLVAKQPSKGRESLIESESEREGEEEEEDGGCIFQILALALWCSFSPFLQQQTLCIVDSVVV